MVDTITQANEINAIGGEGTSTGTDVQSFGLPVGHDATAPNPVDPTTGLTQQQQNERTAFSTSPDYLGIEQGFPSLDISVQAENEARGMSTLELMGKGWATWIPHVAQTIYRGMQEPDPNFDIQKNWDTLTNGIPDQYKKEFAAVRSMSEGMSLRNQILDTVKTGRILAANTGLSGDIAKVFDITGDPINLMYPNVAAGALTKTAMPRLTEAALDGSRLANIPVQAATFSELTAYGQVVNAATDPTYNWATLPQAVITAGAIGGVAGGILGHTSFHDDVSKATKDVQDEINARTAVGKTPIDSPTPTNKPIPTFTEDSLETQMAKLEKEFDENGLKEEDRPEFEAKMDELVQKRLQEMQGATEASVGSAATKARPQEPNFNKSTQNLLNEVRARDANEGIGADAYDSKTYFGNSKFSGIINKFYDFISKTPLGTDFDKFFNSDSVIAQFLGKRMFESASGVGQSINRTASILKEQYQTHIMAPVAGGYKNAFKKWLQENKDTTATEQAWNNNSKRNAFDAEVRTELHSRYFDGAKTSSSAAVHELADLIDEASARAVNVQKGSPGEISVKGAEELQPRSGWFRQIWDGSSIMSTIRDLEGRLGMKDGKQAIIDSISQAYQDLHKWTPDIADKVSKAVLNRALSHAEGSSTQIMGLLDKDSIDFLRETLEADGNSKAAVDAIIDRIRNNTADKGILKSLKSRNDIDLRKNINGSDIPLMRLTQNNILKTWVGYSRQVSGAAGLARHGIQLSELQSKWFPAIKHEIFMRDGKEMPDGLLDAAHSYFSGYGFAGGISPWVRRIQQLVGLSLLDSLGLTKLSELGNVIGMIHMDNFLKTAPSEIKQMVHGKDIPSMQQLGQFNSSIIGDHNIYRPELMLDEASNKAGQVEVQKQIDQLLASGSRVQGYLSGFYKIQQFMQRVAGSGLLNLIHQIANDGAKVSDLRMASLGFTSKNKDAILKYFKDGTVETKDGMVHDLHPEKWNASDFNELASIVTRATAQGVQKSFRGEDFWWAHKSTGAAITWLKNFTLTALHKQLLRNARLADPEALASLTLGLASAGLAYTAKQVLQDKQDSLNSKKVFHGAMKYNNITAPIQDIVDPVSHFLGFNPTGYNQGSIIEAPPIFDAMNRMASIPKALAHGLGKGLSKEDVYNLQAAPLLGSMYGMGYVVNSMKQNIDSAKKASQAQAKTQSQPKQEQPKPQAPTETKETKVPTTAQDVKKIQKMGKGE